jgi:anaerobic magnesium-protoporphyrin IX monomethyl ester cyclase
MDNQVQKKPILLFLIPMYVSFSSFLEPFDNGRSYQKKDGKFYNSLSTDIPLGPISMSAYVKQFVDIDIRQIDFNVELNHVDEFPYDNFRDYCLEYLSNIDFEPDIVGVSSLFSPSMFNFLDCGSVAKELWPEALVLGGGNIPTNSYEHMYNKLGCDYFDGLCFGEGEKPLKDLLLAEDKGKFLEASNSWITKSKSKPETLFIPKHDFIDDLDEIPFFDYDLIDISRNSANPVTTSFHNVRNRIGFHIMTSRGCPYLCTFCASHRTHGRKMRYHSVERVREDLTRLCEQYDATQVIFQDDHLMSDTARVHELLGIVKDLNLDSLYQNGLTLYALDRPMLEAFYNAGVRHLVLPVESGSEKVLKEQMKKPLKFHISERVAADCRDLGIYTNTNIMIGMPGETKADIEEARLNLRRIKTNWFNVACASPLVGSEMYEIASREGFITGDVMGADYHHAVINTDDFSADYIQKMQYIFNLELNFIYNQDVLCGDFETALMGFENVIRVRPDHAFAHYFAANAHSHLGNHEQYITCQNKSQTYAQMPFWKEWFEYFQLPNLAERYLLSGNVPAATAVPV